MHKSDEYGTVLLKQKDKQTDKPVKNFALKLARYMPYSVDEITAGISELLSEKVLILNDDKLIQRRMVRDNEISNKRAEAGKKGGENTQKIAKAKSEANSENEDSISFNKGGVGEKEINISFDVFWNAYGKKVGNKKLCIQRWNKLKDEDRQKIIDTLPSFIASVSDKKYLPYPEKYLNAQRWNDEVVAPTAPVSSTQQFYPQSKGDPQPFIDRNWRQPV